MHAGTAGVSTDRGTDTCMHKHAREADRQAEKDRERERQTERQAEKEKERDRERERERQRHIYIERERERKGKERKEEKERMRERKDSYIHTLTYRDREEGGDRSKQGNLHYFVYLGPKIIYIYIYMGLPRSISKKLPCFDLSPPFSLPLYVNVCI